jgi:hypothetical protein
MSRSGTPAKRPAIARVARVLRATPVLAEEHRENQRDDEPAELGRLQIERTEIDPALGTHLGRSLEEHVHQHRDQAAVNQQRVLRQHPVIDREAHDERDEADDERVDLRPELRPRPTVRAGRDAVDHRQSDAGQHQDRCDEQPVDVEVQSSFEHGTYAESVKGEG